MKTGTMRQIDTIIKTGALLFTALFLVFADPAPARSVEMEVSLSK